MFVYCIWCGDQYENTSILLSHQVRFTEEEFQEFCDKVRTKLINNTTKNHKIIDEVDGKKSIWEYSIGYDFLYDIKKGLIEEYDFKELTEYPEYHVKEVDPYDYPED